MFDGGMQLTPQAKGNRLGLVVCSWGSVPKNTDNALPYTQIEGGLCRILRNYFLEVDRCMLQ